MNRGGQKQRFGQKRVTDVPLSWNMFQTSVAGETDAAIGTQQSRLLSPRADWPMVALV